MFGKQTLAQLASKLKCSTKTIQRHLDGVINSKYQFNSKLLKPRQIVLICDCTYFGTRKDKDGLMVFKDWLTKEVLWWKFTGIETKQDYLEGYKLLKRKGFKVLAATIDGRKGIKDIFLEDKIPVQICQFHIQKYILSKLTKNPLTECGWQLRNLTSSFIELKLTKQEFRDQWSAIIDQYQDVLQRRNEKGEYKHKSLRSALYTIKLNQKYLFTYQDYQDSNIQGNPVIDIPNTTNSLDGGVFKHLKRLLNDHSGLVKTRRNKLINYYFSATNFV